MTDAFWTEIDSQLDAIESQKPDTFAGVVAILGAPFFAGSGGDRQLYTSLFEAGWRRRWIVAGYFYCMQHYMTGAQITYIEGDLLDGDHRPIDGVVDFDV
jgi:hypothetical protein